MTNSPDPSPSTTFFKNAITTLSGITVYLVALLWLMGRSYSRGYHETLAIPPSSLVFSIWDYGELGWVLLWRMVVFLIFVILFYVIRDTIKKPKKRMGIFVSIAAFLLVMAKGFGFSWMWSVFYGITFPFLIYARADWDTLHDVIPESVRIPLIESLFAMAIGIFLLEGGRVMALESGQKAAVNQLTNEPIITTDLVLTQPLLGLPMGSSALTTTEVYTYTKLLVVTTNTEHLFVTSALTTACLPTMVHVIQADTIQQQTYTTHPKGSMPCGTTINTPPLSSTTTIPFTPTP